MSNTTVAEELNHKGAEFYLQGNLEAAKFHFTAALMVDYNNPRGLHNLSASLLGEGKLWAALAVARRGVMAAPGSAAVRCNLGAAYSRIGKFDLAKRELQAGIDIDPGLHGLYHNLGLAHYMDGEFSLAVENYDKALVGSPTAVGLQCDRALGILATGDFLRGIAEYECRWDQLVKPKVWDSGIPRWHGEDIEGKYIILHHEQGFGDSIMLVRFAEDLLNRGAKVTIAVPPPLIGLFTFNFRRCDVVSWEDAPKVPADYWTPMLSAPLHLGISKEKISSEPYLQAPPWSEAPELPQGFRIGIVWESGDHGAKLMERRRVAPLELFFPMAEIPNTRIISLQLGGGPQILNTGAESFIFDAMRRVETFAHTAAIIKSLDLVIAVDSSVAHLAGAMGVPCVVLSPFTRCWRWWDEDSGDPWYSRMWISSQHEFGNWGIAVTRATEYASHRARHKEITMVGTR